MLNVEGATLSKSNIRKMINGGTLSGWDDPQTWTLRALKRRGFQPQAIRNFILKMGLSEADVTVPVEILYAENRKLIDAVSNRYMAVLSPVAISVRNAPPKSETKIHMHPDFPDRGERTLPVNASKIYVEKDDFEKLKGKVVGLINLFSVRLDKTSEFESGMISYDIPKIHWVSEPNTKVKIVMPDGSVKEALAEIGVKDLKEDDLVQFYRVGFCRVDKVGRETVLYFTHK